MNQTTPFPPGQGPQGMPGWGPYVHHDTWWQSGFHLLPLLLLAVLIGVVVWGVLRLSSSGALAASPADRSTPTVPGCPTGPWKSSRSVTLAASSNATTSSSDAPTWADRRRPT